MLTLRRIEIQNFVCFDEIAIEPSTDSDRRLTVIRAENGSGKTTFLRALRWGMYGERGLPGNPSHFSLHPAWWQPDEGGIKTSVFIEFETDGSTRHVTDSTTEPSLYQLVRSVKTISRPTDRDHEPDFRRINERTRLMIRNTDGTWHEHETAPDTIIEQLLPWGLRDFFVMDTDEVADFVGGTENRVVPRHDVETKTTGAVQSLLGIEIFKKACERVNKATREFGAAATRAIGNHNLNELQNELDVLRADHDDLKRRLGEENSRKMELESNLEQRRDDLEEELRESGSYDALQDQLANNRSRHKRLLKTHEQCLSALVADLETVNLLARLASVSISTTYDVLKPLYDQGRIPMRHLQFVRSLLDSGRCVCGQDLAAGSEHRRHVEDRIAESNAQESRANYLHQLHEAAVSLLRNVETSNWSQDRINHAADLADCESELSELKLERKSVDAKLARIDEAKIQVIRDEIAAIEEQLDACKSRLARHSPDLDELTVRIASLERTISQRQRNERAAADYRASEQLSRLVFDVLTQAYTTIEQNQVSELSDRMNRLFHQMAANVSDEDFTEVQRTRVTLRMIADVGVRSVRDRPDHFEIFALNGRGRSMPPVEINGASRRVLALSFVLALCIESQTRAPLIADSLLNFMSGAVRRNTLRITAEHSRQPILLLTNSDLEAPSEVQAVAEHAGSTYTLTGQWDAIDAGSGGDVMNWTETRRIALLCTCGPRQYCDICERDGQRDSPGWTKPDDRGSEE